jgi:uncharacterized OsmC-like protein
MTQQEIRAKIEAAVEYLSAHPEEAHYTDSAATARLSASSGLKVEVSGPDGARMTTDMPTSVGGGGSDASPGWYLRAAEAACVATLIAMRAAQEGVAFRSVEVTVDSESDDRGILGIDDDVPAGPLRTHVSVRVDEVPVDDRDGLVWETIVEWAVDHCPVTDAVRRAVPLTVDLTPTEES